MGMLLRIASSRIVGQGDIVGRSGYFSLNLSANSVMRGRLDARRTLKSLVADLRKKGKREKITIHYIYTCARRARRKRIKTFYKHAGLGGGGSVSIVAASKQGHCFTHSSGSISPLWFRSGLRSR